MLLKWFIMHPNMVYGHFHHILGFQSEIESFSIKTGCFADTCVFCHIQQNWIDRRVKGSLISTMYPQEASYIPKARVCREIFSMVYASFPDRNTFWAMKHPILRRYTFGQMVNWPKSQFALALIPILFNLQLWNLYRWVISMHFLSWQRQNVLTLYMSFLCILLLFLI